MYDPALGRWHVPDPLAEYHYNMSPFSYCQNNPMRYIDPFGLDTLKVDPNTGLPNKDIDEVTVTPSKEPEYDQEFGNPGYGNGGWNPREVSRRQGDPYDHSDMKLGEMARILKWFVELFKRGDDDDENSNSEKDKNKEQTTSDKKIKQNNTGIGEETDGSGKTIYVTKKVESFGKTYKDSVVIYGEGKYADDAETDSIWRKFINPSSGNIDSIELREGANGRSGIIDVIK